MENYKSEIRKYMLNLRNKLEYDYVEYANKMILNKLYNYIIENNNKNIFIYMDMKNEVQTSKLINLMPDINFYIPKTFPNRNMKITKFDKNNLIKHKFGYYEVNTNIYEDEMNLDLIIIPALAIDKNKNRIGFGGGYYDIFLSNLIKNHNIQHTTIPDIIAVCYDFQIIPTIKSEKHDIKPHYVITENKFF